MRTISKFLIGAAGIGAFAAAAPAAAQYPYGYPNTGQNIIGQIIGNVLGYGQYPYGNYGYGQPNYRQSQIAVDQCARSVEARLNNQAMSNRYEQWNPNNYNPYDGWASQGRARVVGITNVELRQNGRLRVTGVATSGFRYRNPRGYGNYAYNRSYGTPDLSFSCRADSSGRVYNVDINRTSYYGRN